MYSRARTSRGWGYTADRTVDGSGQGAKNLQEFFETTLPRILHPVVVGWAQQLYVTPFFRRRDCGQAAQYIHAFAA
jgi:hypothetical protein